MFRAPSAKRIVVTAALALHAATSGCDTTQPLDASTRDARPIDGGPTCTVALDDPATLTTFPDRALLTDDPTTETGRRLHYDPARYSDLSARMGGLLPAYTDDLSEVDGFGVNAEAYFRFGRDFDEARLPAPDDDGASSAAGFVVLGDTPYLVPAILTTEDATLFLSPLTPLPARSDVAAYVTRALTDAAGGCLEPSPTTVALLASPDPATADAIDALATLGVVEGTSELVAITAYPTQSVYEDAVAIAADVAARDFDFATAPACTDDTDFTRCVGSFVAGDYRDEEAGVIRRAVGAAATPATTYTIPFTIWLPRTRTGPVPVLLFQHGLTSNREWGGGNLAHHFAPLGIAVVAIDAVEHGEHPTVTEPREPLDTLQAFFEISLETIDTRAFQPARLRDNFVQSTLDRLQFVRLLVSHPDVDGAPGVDLDPDRLAMLGVSAGGIMVTQHVALDGTIGAAVLVVPGARIATLMSDSTSFAPLVAGLRPRTATAGDARRFFPVIQTIVDRGDPASWAGTLFGEPALGVTRRPDVLVGIALDDAVMPNSGSYALGRALGLPIVEDVLRPTVGFETVASPIAGNLALGADVVTAGFLQFDVVEEDGELVPVDHNNLTESAVGYEAWTHFLTTHFAGAAEIRDPYAALGIEHP